MSGLDRAKNVSSQPVIAPTLQAENLYAQTVTTRNLVVEESITFPENYFGQAQNYSFRNAVINGDVRIDQRNSANVPVVGTGYSADRWFVEEVSDAVLSTQQSTEVPTGQGFINSIRTRSTTANASAGTTEFSVLTYFIEGTDSARFAWGTSSAKTITASFWVKASVTGTYSFTLYNATQSRINPSSYTINAPDTWEKKSITILGETSGTWETGTGRGIIVNFYTSLGSNYLGSSGWNNSSIFGVVGQANAWSSVNNTFSVTGLQIEEGSVATPFEHRPIGTELALCQRYYQRITPGNTVTMAFGHVQSGTTERFTVPIPVSLRTTPVLTATGSFTSVGSNGNFALSSFSVRELESNTVILEAVSATAHSTGPLIMFGVNGNVLAFSSEL
jgi:hypothetical protein